MRMQKITKEMETYMMEEIKQYFLKEREEEIGDLAAYQFLEFVKEKISPVFYNQALSDAKIMVEQKMISTEEELFSMEKRIKR